MEQFQRHNCIYVAYFKLKQEMWQIYQSVHFTNSILRNYIRSTKSESNAVDIDDEKEVQTPHPINLSLAMADLSNLVRKVTSSKVSFSFGFRVLSLERSTLWQANHPRFSQTHIHVISGNGIRTGAFWYQTGLVPVGRLLFEKTFFLA